jgi:diguanylate cyclase (GGDEF)-like protein
MMRVDLQPGEEATGAERSNQGEWEYELWRRHLFMGIGSFTLGAALLFAYLMMTPHGPHRGVLTVIDIAGAACWLGVFAPVGIRVLQTKWRVPFFFLWSVTTLVLIAAGAGLDGGIESPITGLLVLPVLYAALVYPLTTVISLAVVEDVFFVIVAATGPVVSPSRVTMTGVSLGLAGGVAVMAAINRTAQERDRQRLTARLHRLATRDGLTGCLTYQAFQDALEAEEARARRYGRAFSVTMVDLDSFKVINDAHGHAVGDAALRCMAQALLAAARTTDMVGRIGGDEFAVLLPETDGSQSPLVAERLQSHVRAAETPVSVTVSLGTATWSDQFDSAAEVIRRADQALYSAKHAGRDRLVVWEAECRASLDAITAPVAHQGRP